MKNYIKLSELKLQKEEMAAIVGGGNGTGNGNKPTSSHCNSNFSEH